MPSEEFMPFLDQGGRLSDKQDPWLPNLEPKPTNRNSWSSTKICLIGSLLLNVSLLVGYALIARRGIVDPHRFARDSIIYEDKWFHSQSTSSLFQPPSNETDDAWDKVANPHILRFHPEEVSKLGEYPIQVPGSSDFASSLSVYHEIHCLGWLRRFAYPEYYFPNTTKEDMLEQQDHADHCINQLLQSVMCSADTTIVVFHWHENDTLPYYPHPTSSRTCVKWEALEDTIRPRLVSAEELERLQNPFVH